jgi:hypothetical protein
MSRLAFLAAVIALAPQLPEGCSKAFGKGNAAPPKSAQSATPPPPPITSATAPPVWAPPDTGGPPATAQPPPVNPELAKARALAQAGDHKKLRALLEKKVKSGKGSREEAALLMESCVALRDKACMDAVKAKHPEVDGP